MEQLRTVAWSNGRGHEFECVLCGQWYYRCEATVSLADDSEVLDDKDHNVVHHGDVKVRVGRDVCPVCVYLGPAKAADHTRDHAQRLREAASELDALALKVEGITDWATLEDLARAGLINGRRRIEKYSESDLHKATEALQTEVRAMLRQIPFSEYKAVTFEVVPDRVLGRHGKIE